MRKEYNRLMWSGHRFAAMLTDGTSRWTLLASFVEAWNDALRHGDGVPAEALDRAEHRLGIAIPKALRHWYLLAGRRADLNAVQDDLLTPERLQLDDNALVFYAENQWVVLWGIRRGDLDLDDPPVVISDQVSIGHKVWLPEAHRLSDFALAMVIRQTLFRPCSALALCDPAQLHENVLADLAPLPFEPSHWPAFPTTLYAGEDAIAMACPGMVHVATRDEPTLDSLLSHSPPGLEWEDWQ